MKRLTEEIWKGKYTYAGKDKSTKEYDLWVDKVIQKLGKLEDLEEQLGCPLEVVFKALTNGVYVRDFPNENNTLKMFDLNLTNIENEWYLITKFYANVKVKDYKKTWWLKEDKSE